MKYLPEELLSEILKYALRLYPVEKFTYLFVQQAHRPTKLLLVCKQWHRIGTPYLYETVELTSEAHVKMLVDTLQSSNHHLGPMVRNLRIDEAYGRNLSIAAQYMNNVRVLSLRLRTTTKCLTGGLACALGFFNPTELYLHGVGQQGFNTKKAEYNTRTFLKAITSWTALRQISFVHNPRCIEPLSLPPPLVATLSAIPQLSIGGNPAALQGLFQSEWFQHMVQKAGIESITCLSTRVRLNKYIKQSGGAISQDIAALLVYEDLPYYRDNY
ncbi:hypothetical protein BDY19DRAFT_994936 [Irpex rosettiformis]|uniref:Uncharacterized protein n=1 Tax=Irpex rosettiformis TaxID=378272 RepID=A0ACB8U095_9APHY|nr:hypothetical protein BDY19DRAFT_994936 [Irpex rosettiformis]